MRGSGAFRTSVAPGGVLAGPWVRNALWRNARAVPSLDLDFAGNKSLKDGISNQDLITHTRASSATFVDSSGVLRTAVTNFLLRSEEFDNASWTKTRSSISADSTIAPNGSLTADKLVEDTTAGATHLVSVGSGLIAGNTYTYSVYAKAAGRDWLLLSPGGTWGYGWFNISNGTLGTLVNGGSNPTAAISAVGNGWYRCSITSTAVTNLGIQFLATPSNGTVSYTGDGTSGIYLWGAQLEQASTVGDYVPTTSTINSAPRFDHDPTTGESLGLLPEEGRTNLYSFSEQFDDASWAKGNADGTITADQSVSPNGTTTADLYRENTVATTSRYIAKSISITSGQAYSISCWAKQGPGATRYLGLVLTTTGFGANVNASFTLSGVGSFNIASSGTATSASIQAFPGGWYRCTLISQATATVTLFPQIRLSNSPTSGISSYTGDGTSGIYIWGAQLEAGAFPTSYIPTVASTVTRAADVASITGANFGVTRTNLLVRSEEFDNAAWTKTRSSVTANAITAPNGTLTADQLVEDTTASNTHQVSQSASLTAGTHTYSIFAKAGERSVLQTFRSNLNIDLFTHTFNLSTGTASGTGASIVSVGNGWYLCISTVTVNATGSTGINFSINNGSTNSYTGDGTSGIYLWGAQLEVGSAVTPYIQSPSVFTSRASSGTYVGGNGLIQTATTNEARYDHDPVSLISKGLLLEEARTNLILQSEDFSTTWTTTNTTVSTNQVTAPDGATTADKIIETATTAEHNIRQDTASQVAGTYSASIFAKAGERDVIQFVATGVLGGFRANFDLTNGVIGSVDSALTARITPFPNGWYRCNITATSTTTGTLRAQWNIVTSPTAARVESYLGDVTKGLYLWGCAFEAGAIPTSYIPTTTATVTRAADISTSVATSVFESSWYRQDEGTVFYDGQLSGSESGNKNLLGLSNGSSSNVMDLFIPSGLNQRFRMVTGGVQQALQNPIPTESVYNPAKVAYAFKLDDSNSVGNGTVQSTDTSCTIPTVDRFTFGLFATGEAQVAARFKRLTYWPTRLANTTLQRITQP
jgi:hypothetical protein